MIFDSHAHYDDKQFDEDREEVLLHLKDAGVERVVNISNGWDDMLRSFVLIEKYPFMYGTAGIHPCKVSDLNEERMEELRQYCRRDKIVAVGEIGLDYYWMTDPKEVQREWFIRQLRLAKEENLPVVIHSRDASQDTFDIMKAEHAGTTGGVIHCYSGSLEMAREYVKLGYYLGIGGVVTFKNSKVLKKVAAEIPLEHIVVETDCPYLAPTPHRGKRNSSAYLPLVIKEIAALYSGSAIRVLRVSAVTGQGIDELRRELAGKLSAFTGNSGVGKSSILNALDPRFSLAVGEVSKALGRGRHTTRHVELFSLGQDTYVIDTPGFASFDTQELDLELKEHLPETFPEFAPYVGGCRFVGCSHTKEKGCAVLEAVHQGKIPRSRHASYLRLYNELKDLKAWDKK